LNRYQLRTEAGGADGVGVAGGEFIAGEHLLDHAVVGFVLGEAVDGPIAPAPDVAGAVADLAGFAVAVPVGVAPDVEPVAAPAFGVLGAFKELVDDEFVGVGAL
jgi:hypothetical protein